jgi:hypothetical protein
MRSRSAGDCASGQPGLDHLLALDVGRMRLTGQHDLHRLLLIAQQPGQAVTVVQQQVRTFVAGEAPGKTERQCLGV